MAEHGRVGGGSVMIWGCISHDCKFDLVTIRRNLTGDQYIRDVLQPVDVPFFDNHPLATRHMCKDANDRPHHSKAITAYLQSEYKRTFFSHVQENTYSIVDVQPPVYNGLDSKPGLWLSMEE
jgi:hypothetical protein